MPRIPSDPPTRHDVAMHMLHAPNTKLRKAARVRKDNFLLGVRFSSLSANSTDLLATSSKGVDETLEAAFFDHFAATTARSCALSSNDHDQQATPHQRPMRRKASSRQLLSNLASSTVRLSRVGSRPRLRAVTGLRTAITPNSSEKRVLSDDLAPCDLGRAELVVHRRSRRQPQSARREADVMSTPGPSGSERDVHCINSSAPMILQIASKDADHTSLAAHAAAVSQVSHPPSVEVDRLLPATKGKTKLVPSASRPQQRGRRSPSLGLIVDRSELSSEDSDDLDHDRYLRTSERRRVRATSEPRQTPNLDAWVPSRRFGHRHSLSADSLLTSPDNYNIPVSDSDDVARERLSHARSDWLSGHHKAGAAHLSKELSPPTPGAASARRPRRPRPRSQPLPLKPVYDDREDFLDDIESSSIAAPAQATSTVPLPSLPPSSAVQPEDSPLRRLLQLERAYQDERSKSSRYEAVLRALGVDPETIVGTVTQRSFGAAEPSGYDESSNVHSPNEPLQPLILPLGAPIRDVTARPPTERRSRSEEFDRRLIAVEPFSFSRTITNDLVGESKIVSTGRHRPTWTVLKGMLKGKR